MDFHYPHVHYYCKLHIEFLFKKAGFEVVNAVSLKGGHDVGYMLRPVPTSLADAIDIKFEQNTMVRFAAELQVRRARGSVKMHALRGRTALYGANAYSQALVGLYPSLNSVMRIFDDTESYAGHVGFGRVIEMPIMLPHLNTINDMETIIITAYLHDLEISKRLRANGYAGQLYTVRTDPSAGQNGRPASIFM